MAVSTVTQRQRRASDTEVNKRSGFLQTLLGKNTAQPEPDEPNAQSRWLISAVRAELHSVVKALSKPQEPEKPQPVHGEAALYNTHPKPQLRRLAHLALDLEADPALGFRDCVERLHELMDEFSAGALDEFKAQQQYERRVGRNAVVAAAQGAVLEDAARRGEPIDPRSSHGQQVIGDVAGRALSASDPRPTELQAALTPDVLKRMDAERAAQTAVLPVIESVTVAGPASPVHVPGSHPPIPAEDDELADPGAAKPLPKRVPQRRPVEVLPADLALDPYEAVDPTVEGAGLASGAWVFDEGGSTGPVWFLLAEQEDALRDRGRVAVLKFANGFTREVDAGKQVRVLDVRRAQVLLAEHEHKLAARDAENAGAER